jgi:hypothetical protein
MGMSGISKSQVSRLCEEIDEKVKARLSIALGLAQRIVTHNSRPEPEGGRRMG